MQEVRPEEREELSFPNRELNKFLILNNLLDDNALFYWKSFPVEQSVFIKEVVEILELIGIINIACEQALRETWAGG